MLWKAENGLIFSVFGSFGQKKGFIGKIRENTCMPNGMLSFIWHDWESMKVSLISIAWNSCVPPAYMTRSLCTVIFSASKPPLKNKNKQLFFTITTRKQPFVLFSMDDQKYKQSQDRTVWNKTIQILPPVSTQKKNHWPCSM